jgi:hypothetical protein
MAPSPSRVQPNSFSLIGCYGKRKRLARVNAEPILILTASGDIAHVFQMPATVAKAIGQALIMEADRATPKGKPS